MRFLWTEVAGQEVTAPKTHFSFIAQDSLDEKISQYLNRKGIHLGSMLDDVDMSDVHRYADICKAGIVPLYRRPDRSRALKCLNRKRLS